MGWSQIVIDDVVSWVVSSSDNGIESDRSS